MARPSAGLIWALTLVGAAPSLALAGAPGADRYGPAPAAAPDVYAGSPQGSAVASRETMRAPPPRMLSWPGKSASSPPPAAPPASQTAAAAPRLAPSPGYPPRSYAAPAYATGAPSTVAPAAVAPSAVAVSPRFAASTSPQAPPPAPYFAAPTPGTPPPASTSLSGPLASASPAGSTQHARLYSVHREYGMQPDPAPIPPQFFAQTADLSEPATTEPTPSRAANAATRNAVNAARLAAEAN